MALLSRSDHDFFDKNGYVVIPEAVPEEERRAVIRAMEEFLGVRMEDPSTWYQAPCDGSGTIELYQHQAMWNIRQHPRVHQAFAEIWKDEKLWVSMDRCGYKPPWSDSVEPKWRHKGFIHIDADEGMTLPLAFAVQGVLYLTDTDADMGGFHCIPGWHRRTAEWRKIQPRSQEFKGPHGEELPAIRAIPGKAGDLLIWHRGLPHGSGKNTSNKVRLCQYISMFKANKIWGSDFADGKPAQRVSWWRDRKQPPYDCFPGDKRGWEAAHYGPAELSPLGRKLLGLDSW